MKPGRKRVGAGALPRSGSPLFFEPELNSRFRVVFKQGSLLQSFFSFFFFSSRLEGAGGLEANPGCSQHAAR